MMFKYHPYQHRAFSISLAKRCAWRAIYFYLFSKVPRFYIGINPDYQKPTLFGGYYIHRNWQGRFPRIKLPTIRWRYPHGKLWLVAYKLNSKFWHKMDGRWGWFTPNS